jgi:hypothetical protein
MGAEMHYMAWQSSKLWIITSISGEITVPEGKMGYW